MGRTRQTGRKSTGGCAPRKIRTPKLTALHVHCFVVEFYPSTALPSTDSKCFEADVKTVNTGRKHPLENEESPPRKKSKENSALPQSNTEQVVVEEPLQIVRQFLEIPSLYRMCLDMINYRVAKNYVPPYTLEFLRSLYYFAVDDVNTMCEHTTSIKINLSELREPLHMGDMDVNYENKAKNKQRILDNFINSVKFLGNFKLLKKLQIRYLSISDWIHVGDFFTEIPQLTELSLPFVHVSPTQLRQILRQTPNLETLDLSLKNENQRKPETEEYWEDYPEIVVEISLSEGWAKNISKFDLEFLEVEIPPAATKLQLDLSQNTSLKHLYIIVTSSSFEFLNGFLKFPPFLSSAVFQGIPNLELVDKVKYYLMPREEGGEERDGDQEYAITPKWQTARNQTQDSKIDFELPNTMTNIQKHPFSRKTLKVSIFYQQLSYFKNDDEFLTAKKIEAEGHDFIEVGSFFNVSDYVKLIGTNRTKQDQGFFLNDKKLVWCHWSSMWFRKSWEILRHLILARNSFQNIFQEIPLELFWYIMWLSGMEQEYQTCSCRPLQ